MKLQKNAARRGETRFAYAMLSPMLTMFVCFGLIPICYSFGISLTNYRLNINRPTQFVGLQNYAAALKDNVFLESLPKTFFFVVIVITGSVVIGFLFASLVNSKHVKRKELFVLIGLLPWAVPKVVSGLMWKWILDGNYGILNVILKDLGIISHFQWWFNINTWVALLVCAIVEVWRLAPFAALLFFAGMQNIPAQLYEAAELDGAGWWGSFKNITMPSLSPVLMSVMILLTTWSMKTFDTVYVQTAGGPGTNTMISYIYIYLQAFNYQNISYASALGYLFTLIILAFLLLYYKALGRDNT